MRYLSILLFCTYGISFAQKEYFPIIESKGHTATVKALQFSLDGNFLYSFSDDKTIRMWDLNNNRLFQTFRNHQKLGKVGMINSGDVMLFSETEVLLSGGFFDVKQSGGIHLNSAYNGKFLSWYSANSGPVVCITHSKDGRFIASGDNENRIGLYDVIGNHSYNFTAHTDGVYGLSFSPDGNKLVSGGYDGQVIFWDIKKSFSSGEQSYIAKKEHTAEVSNVSYSPKGKYVVSVGFDNRILLWNEAGEFIKEIDKLSDPVYGDQSGFGDIHTVDFSADGKKIVVGATIINGPAAIVYAIPSGEKLYEFAKHDNSVIRVRFKGNDTIASTGGLNRDIYVWNAKNGEVYNHFKGNGKRVFNVFWEQDEKKIYLNQEAFMSQDNYYDLKDKVTSIDLNDLSISKGFEYSDVKGFQKTFGNLTLTEANQLEINISNGVKINLEAGYHGSISSFTFTNKGEVLVGCQYRLILFDTLGNQLKELDGHQAPIYDLCPLSGYGNYVLSGSADQTAILWNLDDPAKLNMTYEEFKEDSYSVYGKEAVEKYINEKGEDAFKEMYKGSIHEQIFPSYTIFLNENNEWIIWDKNNYYATSKNGSTLVGFYSSNGIDAKGDFQSFQQFDIILNRPDKILTSLGFANKEIIEIYKKAYEKRLQKLNIVEDSLVYPLSTLDLTMKSETGIVKSSKYKLNFDLKAEDKKLDKLYITINGVPNIPGGQDMSGMSDGNQMMHLIYMSHVKLEPGANNVQAWATDEQGIQSNVETIDVYFDTVEIKPNLYYIGIGSGKFKNAEFDLKYAEKDVVDFSDFYANSNLFGTKNIQNIVGTDVTIENIKKAFDNVLANAKSQDVLICYFAGHGVLDKDFEYFLSTNTINFENPIENGLPYSMLDNMIANLPCKKRIVFIDACHSGEFDKEELAVNTEENVADGELVFRSVNSNFKSTSGSIGAKNVSRIMSNMFVDLRVNSGAQVIASSGGGEFALEGEKWKNGLFTYCLLEGLSTKKADLNQDGEIRLSEIKKYVYEQVRILSNGNQNPTNRFENVSTDFVFWK